MIYTFYTGYTGKCRLEPSKTGSFCHSEEKRFRIRFAGYKTDSAGIGRISCSAGFMEKVSGTKFICKRDYISCNHGNRKRVYRENEFLARKVNEVSYHGTY